MAINDDETRRPAWADSSNEPIGHWNDGTNSPRRPTVKVAVKNWLRTQVIDENKKFRLSASTWFLLIIVVLIWLIGVPYTVYVTLKG